MTDESNDIAVLKQIVLVGKYKMSDSGVKTSFLHIQDKRMARLRLLKRQYLIFCRQILSIFQNCVLLVVMVRLS